MATNLFKKAAEYRKKHKGLTMPEAVKAVSKGAKVSGKKKTVKKAASKKKTKPATLKGIRPRRTHIKVATTKKRPAKIYSAEHHIMQIIEQIKHFESIYKKTRGKDEKSAIAAIINSLHDKLDSWKKKLKK